MKKLLLLSVLALSFLTVACGGDASTCEEAHDVVADECEGNANYSAPSKEESVDACNASGLKEELIECSNAGDCDAILACNLKVVFGSGDITFE